MCVNKPQTTTYINSHQHLFGGLFFNVNRQLYRSFCFLLGDFCLFLCQPVYFLLGSVYAYWFGIKAKIFPRPLRGKFKQQFQARAVNFLINRRFFFAFIQKIAVLVGGGEFNFIFSRCGRFFKFKSLKWTNKIPTNRVNLTV